MATYVNNVIEILRSHCAVNFIILISKVEDSTLQTIEIYSDIFRSSTNTCILDACELTVYIYCLHCGIAIFLINNANYCG